MNLLVILNDPPYGTERSYNVLRLAGSLAKQEGTSLRAFLMGDATSCATAGQCVPQGFYNIERILRLRRWRSTQRLGRAHHLDHVG